MFQLVLLVATLVQPLVSVLQHLEPILHDANLQHLSVILDTRKMPLQQAKGIWHQLAYKDRNLTIQLFTNNSEPSLQATTISEFAQLLNFLSPSPNELLYSTILTAGNATRRGNAVLILASKVLDNITPKEKERSKLDLMKKHIKVHAIWMGKNISHEANLIVDLTNTTGGHFLYVLGHEENENFTAQDKRSGRMRWPLDKDTRKDGMVKFQHNATNIDLAVPQKLAMQSDTSVQRRSGQDRADYRISNIKPNIPLTVEINEQSTLFAQPGQTVMLYFEVTNHYERQLFFYYYCNTEYSEVVNIQPYWGWVQGGETVVVKTLLRVGNNQQVPSDTVLFTASGAYTVAKKIYLYFRRQIEDVNKPEVSYKVNGDCNDVDQPSVCEATSWNLQATIQDKESGLLKVMSLPEGVIVPSDFIVGTKESVNIRYTATCCYPKVDLIATDLNGNQYKKSIDVNHIWLSTGSILAIVLGVLLLLIIIIVIIVIIRLCIHRRRRLSFRTNN